MTAIPIIPRHLLAKHFAGDLRMIAAFEDMNSGAAETQSGTTSNLAATEALQDATVLVLSSNGAFTNERILKLAQGLRMIDDGTFLTISPDETVARTQGYAVTLVPSSESQLSVPASGTVITNIVSGLAATTSYANDAAAAAGGVPIDGLYRNGSVVQVRVT